MRSDTFIQLAQLGAILVGFLSVVVTLRSHRRQMHAQMFIEFSSRLHNVLRVLPLETWTAPCEGERGIPPRSEDLARSCLLCFHIIADLHRLYKSGYISQDLWKPWQGGIRRTMQRPLLRREWLALEEVFEHAPDFRRYMRGLIHGDENGRCLRRHCHGDRLRVS